MIAVVAPAGWAHEIDAWVSSLRAGGRPETTVALRSYHVRRLGAELRTVTPWTVTGEELERWAAGQTWGRETRRSWRSSLRLFWAWGVRTGRTSVHAAEFLPTIRPVEPRPMPASESAYSLAQLTATPRERLMVRLAGDLGMRRGEVAVVHARDVLEDVVGYSLLVHGKGGRDRLLPMPDELAVLVVAACREGDGYAFPGRVEGHISAQRVGKLVSALLPEGVTMHKLRHRFGTLAYDVDRDLLAVQQLLGHASPTTTQRYVAVGEMRRRALVLAINPGRVRSGDPACPLPAAA